MAERGGDQGNAVRGAKRKPPRVSAGGRNAETYVETGAQALTVPQELEELYVDDKLPKNGKAKKNGKPGEARAAKARNGKGAKASAATKAPPAAPAAKKGNRAAERRRARGDVPLGPEAGTSTALNQKQQRQHARVGESGQLKYATGVLTCVKGPEEGLALNLLEGSYTVGRGRDNSFVLKDIASSRRHLRIDVEAGRVTVTDMGSGNGTRVNGKTMQMFVLEEGDRVELGNSVLVFSRLGGTGDSRSAPSSSHADLDGAQARIERAAEKLAAELGDRFRDSADAPSDDERDAVPTSTARPRGRKSSADEPSKRKARPPMPDELWNDALTHVPLSEVVPADSPLGPKEVSGPPRQARPAVRAERPAPAPPPPARDPPPRASTPRPSPARTPPPLDFRIDDDPAPPTPRPAPLGSAPIALPPRPPPTLPPRPAQAVYGVVADKPAAPAWTYVVLPALVVVLVLGTALGGWALYRYVKGSSATQSAATGTEHEEPVRLALEALAKDDVNAALVHAQRAYELRPNDVTVVALLKSIQDRKTAMADAPKPPPVQPVEDAEKPVQTEPVAEAAPAPPPEPVVEKQAAPPPVAEKVEPKAAPPVVRKETPKPRPKPKPRPRPRRQQRKQMSDDAAGKLFKQAVRAVRDNDEARGCTLLRQVAKEAPSGSNWKVKASNAVGRYGCD